MVFVVDFPFPSTSLGPDPLAGKTCIQKQMNQGTFMYIPALLVNLVLCSPHPLCLLSHPYQPPPEPRPRQYHMHSVLGGKEDPCQH